MMRYLWIWLVAVLLPGAQADELRFEARVEAVSAIPDPQRSDYKDCLFALKVAPRVPPGDAPCSVILVLEAFRNRELTAYADLAVGEIIRVHALPFEEIPQEYQSMQLVDDTDEIDLPLLGGVRVARMSAFSDAVGWAWRGMDPKPREVVGVPKNVVRFAGSREARQATIRRERRRIEAQLAAHGTWSEWFDALAPVREELLQRLAEAPDGYLRTDAYVLETDVGIDYRLEDGDGHYRSVLRAIETMQQEWARLGTDLIVMPIPQRDLVYASKFARDMPEDGILQPYWLKFQHDLLSRGIEVLDLLPAYVAALDESDYVYHYNTTDGHPATTGVILAAEALHQRFKRYWFATPRRAYGIQEHRYGPIDLEVLFEPHHLYPKVAVGEPNGSVIENVDASEILLMGDSMVNAPAAARHGQLLHHMARHTGFPVTILKRAGSAHTLTRALYRDVDLSYLRGRKVCVFVFAFTAVSHGEREWENVRFVSGRQGWEAAP